MGLETWQTVLEHTTVYSTASSWLACALDDVSSVLKVFCDHGLRNMANRSRTHHSKQHGSSWLACALDDVSSGCVKSAAATELTV